MTPDRTNDNPWVSVLLLDGAWERTAGEDVYAPPDRVTVPQKFVDDVGANEARCTSNLINP